MKSNLVNYPILSALKLNEIYKIMGSIKSIPKSLQKFIIP